MPATTVKGGKVKGEGRVISINAKYGFLAAQGINSKVFIIPSSLKLEAPFPPLTDELHIDDLVTFEANEQVERNGARYLAVDGSVKLKQRGKDVMVEGEGKIVRLDVIRGCFGFIESPKVGSVFFNISAVRPSTTDVTKILKLGQKVKFRALPNLEQPNCKWRASVVCAFNKASEYLQNNRGPSSPAGASVPGASIAIGGNASNSVAGSQVSSANAAASNSMSPSSTADSRHRKPANHRSGSADNPSGHRTAIGSAASAVAAANKSSSFCSSTCASTENLHTSGGGGVSGPTANGVLAPSGPLAADVGVIGSGVGLRATSPPDFLSAPGSSSYNTNSNNNANGTGHVTRSHHDFGAIGTTATTAPPYGGEFSSSSNTAAALQSLSPIGSSSINNYNNSSYQQQQLRRPTASSSSSAYEGGLPLNSSSSTNNNNNNLVVNNSTNNNINNINMNMSSNNLNNGLINNSNCSSNSLINNTTNNGPKTAKNCDYGGPSNNFSANNVNFQQQQQQIHLHNNNSNNIHNANTNNCNNNATTAIGATSSGVGPGANRLSSWPTSVDPMGVNPAAMWDLYLEQQQKALNQNFNPFAAPSSTEIFPFYHQQHQNNHHQVALQNNHHQAALHQQQPPLQQQQYYGDNESISNNSNKLMANGHAASAMGAPPTGPGPASFDYDQSAASAANMATPGGGGDPSAPSSQQQQRHLQQQQARAAASSSAAPPVGDDICRHIKRLAHELNGWRSSDECAFCRGEESF